MGARAKHVRSAKPSAAWAALQRAECRAKGNRKGVPLRPVPDAALAPVTTLAKLQARKEPA